MERLLRMSKEQFVTEWVAPTLAPAIQATRAPCTRSRHVWIESRIVASPVRAIFTRGASLPSTG